MSHTEELFWIWMDLFDQHHEACSRAWRDVDTPSDNCCEEEHLRDLLFLAEKYIQEAAA